MGRECPEGCARWAESLFGDCVCSVRDGVSLGLGLASVVAWGLAEVPQVVTNFMRGSAEGVSVGFVLAWLVGDVLNLAGCLLTDSLPTQVYVAALYTATTVVLFLQQMHYRRGGRGAEGKGDPDLEGPLLEGEGSAPASASGAVEVRQGQRQWESSGLLSSSPRTLSFSPPGHQGRSPSAALGGGGGSAALVAAWLPKERLGPFLGWAMAGIYLAGRIPQVVHNAKRGSVEGLSPSMFALAIVGNSTYLASILVRSLAWPFLRANLPWVADAGVCLLLDFVILGQYAHLTRRR